MTYDPKNLSRRQSTTSSFSGGRGYLTSGSRRPVTRREFLNYAWLASIALFSVEMVGLNLWFAFPNFKAGQFGGEFTLGQAADVLPEVNAAPIPYTEGKFWLVNLDLQAGNGEPRGGILALYKVCTHLGCLYDWVSMTNRFECPCHGSKFELTGDYISGPARRSLDRFVFRVMTPDGSIKETDAEGHPLAIDGTEILRGLDWVFSWLRLNVTYP